MQCLYDCPHFAVGVQYVTYTVNPSGNARTHGSRILVTCARSYSQLQNFSDPSSPIDESVCLDGAWTPLKLQCVPDCTPLHLSSEFAVHGIGFKFGAERSVSCAFRNSSNISVVCSEKGEWLISERRTGSLPQVPLSGTLFNEKMLGCSRRERKSNAWIILSILIVSFCLCLSCFICTCFAARHYNRRIETRRVGTQVTVDEANVAVVDDALDQGEFETSALSIWSTGRKSESDFRYYGQSTGFGNILTRLPSMSSGVGRLSSYRNDDTVDSEGKSAACLMNSCGRPTTHMCFPCNHFVLCVICASELMDESAKGGATRCPACREFVTCAIDARPAPVFSSRWRLPRWLRSHR